MENILRFSQKRPKSFMSHAKGHVYLLQWEERGDEFNQPAFYFLLVPNAKKTAFERVAGKKSFVLDDYGRVVHWGYGEPDSEDIAKVQNGDY